MIELRPSSIVIHNYEEGDCSSLEKSLGVWDDATFQVTWKAMYFEDNKVILPRGYDLDYLKKLFPHKKIMDNSFKASPKRKVKINLKLAPKDLRQQRTIEFLEASTAYFGYAANKTQKSVCLKTGDGKTFVSTAYIAGSETVAVIILDQEMLIKQWKDRLLEYTDLKESDIGIIVGSEKVRTLMSKPATHKIYLASHRTLGSYAGNNHELIGKLFKHLGIGIKIFDEAYKEWKNLFMIDCYSDVASTIYLTATPERSNKREDSVYQRMFIKVVQYGLEHKFHEEEKHHKVIYVDYNTSPSMDMQIFLEKGRRGFNVNGWYDYIEENCFEYFMQVLVQLIEMAFKGKPDTKIVIILYKLRTIELAIDYLHEVFPSKSIGNYTTMISGKDREKEFMNDIILSTPKSFGAAIDVPTLECLINTVPFSSQVVTEQLIGRLRAVGNKPTLYFDLTDKGFKSCKDQKRSRSVFLNNKAKKIYSIEIDKRK
jgi:hypothetical protein